MNFSPSFVLVELLGAAVGFSLESFGTISSLRCGRVALVML